jgi:hypothetical protein
VWNEAELLVVYNAARCSGSATENMGVALAGGPAQIGRAFCVLCDIKNHQINTKKKHNPNRPVNVNEDVWFYVKACASETGTWRACTQWLIR